TASAAATTPLWPAGPRPSTTRAAKAVRSPLRMVQKNAPIVNTDLTITTLLSSAKIFSTLLRVIATSGIAPDSISGTVFAPTNAAFAKLPAELLQTLQRDALAARQLVLRHVVLDTVPVAKLNGNGFLNAAFDGLLPYSSYGGKQLKIDGVSVTSLVDQTFQKGMVHAICSVLKPPSQKWPSFEQTYIAPPAAALKRSQAAVRRAQGAAIPATLGGRKAMGLLEQKPFWMYGPPYNAAKQEEYEPISVAVPDVSSVDYQLMPPGSVVVVPDSVNALELNPVSGMSKYIGQTKRITGQDALSDYSKLD
ncbi:unnamed protein product, partial [Agarophyton chilense]